MKRMLIRYKVKPDRADENQSYIRKVFEELHRDSPAQFRYIAFKHSDGVTFVHLVSFETETHDNPLLQSPAFRAFQAEIQDRCEEPPVAIDVEEVGSYHFFGN